MENILITTGVGKMEKLKTKTIKGRVTETFSNPASFLVTSEDLPKGVSLIIVGNCAKGKMILVNVYYHENTYIANGWEYCKLQPIEIENFEMDLRESDYDRDREGGYNEDVLLLEDTSFRDLEPYDGVVGKLIFIPNED